MNTAIATLPITAIVPGNNDRRVFARAALEELADSIRANGLAQPPTVVPIGADRYQLVAGERRWRACQLAGLTHIPAIVRADLTPKQASAIMLTENLARVDLNAIEEAQSYRARLDDGWTLEELTATGVSTQRVKARLPLLALRSELQELVRADQLGVGYALAIAAAGLDDNRQAIAVRRLRDNPAPELSWFRRVCGELANEQASQSFEGFMAGPIVPDAAPVKATLPPHPRKDSAPVVGANQNEKLRNQAQFWTDAAARWDYLGKSQTRDECLARAQGIADVLALLDSVAGEQAPAERISVPMADMFTSEEAADYLSLTLAALKYHVRAGNLVGVTVLGRLAFTREELDTFKVNRRRPGNPGKRG